MRLYLFVLVLFNFKSAMAVENGYSINVPSIQDQQDPTIFYAHVEPQDISFSDINKVCKEFKSFHLKDVKRLEEVFVTLKQSVLNQQQTSSFIAEINEIVARIQHDSKAEWNQAVVGVLISWNIPSTHFFIAPEFSTEHIEKNNFFNGAKLKIDEPIRSETRYMGYPNKLFFDFEKNSENGIWYARYEDELHSYVVIYGRYFTFFEICQLIESFEIDADFKVQDFLASNEKQNIKTVKFRIKKGVDNELQ